MITVIVSGESKQVPINTPISDLFGDQDVVSAVLNNQQVSLHTRIEANCVIRPVTKSDPLSRATVRRSISHMFHSVVHRELSGVRPVIGQSMLGGYFYELIGLDPSTDLAKVAALLDSKMRQLTEARVSFASKRVPIESVGAHVTDIAGHKVELLRSWSTPMVPVVELEGFADIQHGPYTVDTRWGEGTEVIPYPPGIVLRFPDAPDVTGNASVQLFSTYRETRDWNRRVGVSTVGALNSATLDGEVASVIRVAEAQHEKKIVQIADAIAHKGGDLKLVCIAGPSSSGKSTFVKRLSDQLRVNGIRPHLVSLDDYYRDRSDCPRDENGELDYETLDALDVEYLDEQLRAVMAGETVAIPRFDFVKGRRDDSPSAHIQLGEGEVVLIEGIHGLNPRIAESVASTACFRIYINALTQLTIDEHNRIFTADGRLLRRIVRDRRYRGTNAADTIARWPSVLQGEHDHIFPHESNADAVFNSALIYEAAMLKTFAWRYLLEVPREHPSRMEAYRLLKFLDLFVPLFPDHVPATSVLREFLGGSGFAY